MKVYYPFFYERHYLDTKWEYVEQHVSQIIGVIDVQLHFWRLLDGINGNESAVVVLWFHSSDAFDRWVSIGYIVRFPNTFLGPKYFFYFQ